MLCFVVFFFEGYGDHRDLHVLTHSFPTRRSSDLRLHRADAGDRRAAAFPGAGADLPGGRHVLADETARSRSEEHTSELQSLMRISYAVFCLKKKKKNNNI